MNSAEPRTAINGGIPFDNIIIMNGRADSLINGKANPWYEAHLSNASLYDASLKGDMLYNEDLGKYIFDIYIYDYGQDGIPGDPFIDIAGDGMLQIGECLNQLKYGGFLFDSDCDCGLDGLCPGDAGYINPDSEKLYWLY